MIGGFVIFLLYLLIILIGDFREKRTKLPASLHTAVPCVDATDIIYDGATKKVSIAEIESILEKNCAYYSSLQKDLKERFLKRTDSFISNKIFIVKSSEGYKEMPVLVSAAAVQLTFGLKEYLLPFYKYICIHPREYFGNESLKILAGKTAKQCNNNCMESISQRHRRFDRWLKCRLT